MQLYENQKSDFATMSLLAIWANKTIFNSSDFAWHALWKSCESKSKTHNSTLNICIYMPFLVFWGHLTNLGAVTLHGMGCECNLKQNTQLNTTQGNICIYRSIPTSPEILVGILRAVTFPLCQRCECKDNEKRWKVVTLKIKLLRILRACIKF